MTNVANVKMPMEAPAEANDAELVNQNGQRIGAKGRRTRQRLIDVTVALLATQGLRDLTVAEVARVAETSPATFYVYFEGVPEVVLAALEQSTQCTPDLHTTLEIDWLAQTDLGQAQRFVALYVATWGQYRTIFRVRNLAAEEGDVRFIAARTAAARPILMALADRVGMARAAHRLPEALDDVATAATITMLLERLSSVGPTPPMPGSPPLDRLVASAAYMVAVTLGARISA